MSESAIDRGATRAVMLRVIAVEDTQPRADRASIGLVTRMSAKHRTSTFVSSRGVTGTLSRRFPVRALRIRASATGCDSEGARGAENNLVQKDYYATVLSVGEPMVFGSPMTPSRDD